MSELSYSDETSPVMLRQIIRVLREDKDRQLKAIDVLIVKNEKLQTENEQLRLLKNGFEFEVNRLREKYDYQLLVKENTALKEKLADYENSVCIENLEV